MSEDTLRIWHLLQLKRDSAISEEVIEKRGYRSIEGGEALKHGFKPYQCRPGLLIPLYAPNGENSIYLLRPDTPRVGKEDGKTRKYEWPAKQPVRIDVSPSCQHLVNADSGPIIITEGIKKGDALASHLPDYLPLALNGVWGWKQNKKPHPDLDLITWKDRQVYICFDSDISQKSEVQLAMRKLTEELWERGAKVKPIYLPPGENGVKVGIDDYFSGHSADDFLALLAASPHPLPPPMEEEKLIPTTEDYISALTESGYNFRLNSLDDSIEVNEQRLTDPLAAKIRSQMRDLEFRDMKAMEDAYIAHALDNAYNPIKDFLNSLVWDGQPHIDNLASHFTDTSATEDHPCPTFHLWLKRWLVGAVAKVFEQAQNAMLTLDGPQGIGKSHFASWLCPLPNAFIEGPIAPDDKDSLLRLIRSLLWEVGELGATIRKADVESLKFFISQRTVTVRAPYGRRDIVKPATASLIGTVNNSSGFLNDPTGSRRFLTVTLTAIDWNYSKLDSSQVWAEAMHLYRNGEPWQLSKAEAALRDKLNSDYEVENPTLNWLERYFDLNPNGDEFTTTTEIIQTLQNYGLRDNTRAISMNVAATLKKKGLRADRKGNERGYYGISLKKEYQDKKDAEEDNLG